ncbi:hypothetical protein L1278_003400 [Pontibacter sp. HSC-36F09]|nr:hypothetical protein [Pontibacter sp. HSC-36F09]
MVEGYRVGEMNEGKIKVFLKSKSNALSGWI